MSTDHAQLDGFKLTDSQVITLAAMGDLGEYAAHVLDRERHDHSIGMTGQDDHYECELWASLLFHRVKFMQEQLAAYKLGGPMRESTWEHNSKAIKIVAALEEISR